MWAKEDSLVQEVIFHNFVHRFPLGTFSKRSLKIYHLPIHYLFTLRFLRHTFYYKDAIKIHVSATIDNISKVFLSLVKTERPYRRNIFSTLDLEAEWKG